jgi:hypothetical protein
MYLESNTPSAVIKSQEIDGLEAWLKKNKPTVIPPGVSLGEVKFVDNSKVKRDLEQEKKAKAETIKRNKLIEAQNKERERLAKLKMKEISQASQRKQAIAAQCELLTPFYERAKRPDITNLSKLTNISSTDLRFALTKKALNSEQFNTLKAALENFEWFAPKPRTPTKRKTSKPRKKLTAEQIERKERWNIANKARKEAVANGLTEFMAVCGHHGETQYTLGSKGQARCMACMKEKSAKYNSAKQTPEQKAKFERQTKNKGLMVAAVESGFMHFDGVCDKHGISKFVINKKAKQYPNTYPFQYKCHKCKYEYAAELKKKRREVAKAKQAMI